MSKTWNKDNWISYAKLCWLADCDISEFDNCEKEQIDLLMETYFVLDMNHVKISDYKLGPIHMIMSNKLDKRQSK